MENPIKMDDLVVALFSETSTKTPCNIDDKIILSRKRGPATPILYTKTVMKGSYPSLEFAFRSTDCCDHLEIPNASLLASPKKNTIRNKITFRIPFITLRVALPFPTLNLSQPVGKSWDFSSRPRNIRTWDFKQMGLHGSWTGRSWRTRGKLHVRNKRIIMYTVYIGLQVYQMVEFCNFYGCNYEIIR